MASDDTALTVGQRAQLEALSAPLTEDLRANTEQMLAFALAHGKPLPAWLVNAVSKVQGRQALRDKVAGTPEAEASVLVRDDLRTLGRVHEALTALVAPATPATIKASALAARTVARLQWAAGGSVVLAMALQVGVDTAAPSGMSAVVLQTLHVASYALVGSTFQAMLRLRGASAAGTVDPAEADPPVGRVALGMMSGFVLWTVVDQLGLGASLGRLSGPLVALLGGYGVEAVRKLLDRLLVSVEAFVAGSFDDALAVERDRSRMAAEVQVTEARARIAADLMALDDELGDRLGDDGRLALRERIRSLLAEAGERT